MNLIFRFLRWLGFGKTNYIMSIDDIPGVNRKHRRVWHGKRFRPVQHFERFRKDKTKGRQLARKED